MSLSELATVARWKLPLKILLLNNQGHGMCRQTQRQWLGASYPATSLQGGLGFPDFEATASAFHIETHNDLASLFEGPQAGFLEVEIHPDAQMIPQARYGQPLEDPDPQLPREEFRAQMIVPPL
jgi:acetolactate synthase-1/2/3 large subunit